MPSYPNRVFSAEEFYQALNLLDQEVIKSKNLRKAVPINLISAGGFLAVSHFGNRAATRDIDFILDPEITNLDKIREKLQKAILGVAKKLDLDDEWINSRMEIFAVGETRKQLFRESIQQGKVLWQGKNLLIYAAKWEWMIARKLKRIGSQNRDIDVSDAVEILAVMVRQQGVPLTRSTVKAWDTIVYTPIDDAAIDKVAAAFLAKYGSQGIA